VRRGKEFMVLKGLALALALGLFGNSASAQSRAVETIGGEPAALLAQLKQPPLGLPAMSWPANNPPTSAGISLGRKLFFDRRLSFNHTLSCAMCHIPEQGFTHNEMRTPVGLEGRFVKRNAPALYNVGYRQHLFHDGREFSLENQVWQPLLKVNEMANPSIGHVIETLRGAPDYQGLFEAAFDEGPSVTTIGMALASYQRALVSANSPFDRYYFAGEQGALSASAKRGMALFFDHGCSACHTIGKQSALFSDGGFHDTGIGFHRSMRRTAPAAAVRLAPGVELIPSVTFELPPDNDLGRYEATGVAADRWLYSTPSLRNIALSAPYMHDGSLPDLAAVVDFYNAGGLPHPGLDARLKSLELNRGQRQDMVSFLESLTGSNTEVLRRDARATAIGDRQLVE
jgi:cytochrome c peroxidase